MEEYEGKIEFTDLRVDAGVSMSKPQETGLVSSMAYEVFDSKYQNMITWLIADNDFEPEIANTLDGLRLEIKNRGLVTQIQDDYYDNEFWLSVYEKCLKGKTWFDVPLYVAEAYYFRRIAGVTGYFENEKDYFSKSKNEDLVQHGIPFAEGHYHVNLKGKEGFDHCVQGLVWSNQIDLSHHNYADNRGKENKFEDILIDQSGKLWGFINSKKCKTVAIVCDNAGTEFVSDLVFVDFLLNNDLVEGIHLHIKTYPFFVSDVIKGDITSTLGALAKNKTTKPLVDSIRLHIDEGKIRFKKDDYSTSSAYYYQQTEDLKKYFESIDLVIMKGDLNYRRLAGDVIWEHENNFDDYVKYFPTSVAAIRSIKSDVMLGYTKEQDERLKSINPVWMRGGEYGEVQVYIKN